MLALGVATVLPFAGCGGDVDSNKAEEEIKKGLTAQTKGDVKYVKCPEGVNAQKGGTFKCEALIPVNVTQVDENGNIRWQITSFIGPPAGATGATGTTAPGGATGAGATGPGLVGGPGPQPGATGATGAAGGVADDNRFVTYRNRSEGYSISHPARWQKVGSGRDVNVSHPSGIVFAHVVIFKGKTLPTVAEIRASLKTQANVQATQEVTRATVNGQPAITARFTFKEPGARATKVINRYVFAKAGKRFVLEIGSTEALSKNKALKKRLARVLRSFRFLDSGT